MVHHQEDGRLFFLTFVIVFVHLLGRISMFPSNFSIISGISAGEKFALRTFFAGKAMLKKQREPER